MPDKTWTRIMDEARTLFSQHTYGGTSMQQIAAAVGITKASLYHYHAGKSAILALLVREPLAELEGVFDRIHPQAEQEERRDHVLNGFAWVMIAHRQAMGLLLRDDSVRGEQTAEVVNQFQSLIDRARDVLADGFADWRRRLLATQALGAVTNPVALFADIPANELHIELVRGAHAILALRHH
ncbi:MULTISPECIES: TetR/AcrR family transcriptional regulator [unclassified Crossiella]|uniref:TetR/AcrR family transcriptional regulator n=1 Tax=unclassified Crossiella TaxID=2620835 RepID=UPI001FFF44C8|nr:MULTISPECIES: TetR/AcrR family transcriptional regulator [unclassified Crossiella]MCK2241477.1 TetR/AcrR family transcriptional regulator [Crossiella sp. S99.2]MCK2255651.1 TetR/AcrR family transcriptional regulator [Crossiella sp. S99.1]